MVLNVLVHSVRSEIQFARPRYSTHFDPDLSEGGWIEKVREDSAVKTWLETHGPFGAIDEADPKRAIVRYGHRHDAPRHLRIGQRRHHFKGAIRAGAILRLANSHAASNST